MHKIQPNQIEAWVSNYFPDYERKVDKNGEVWLLISNPFYTNDKKKFNISTHRAMCHDWRGDEFWAGPPNPKTGKLNRSFVKFVKLYKNVTYSQAITEIVGAKDAWKYIHPSNIIDKEEITKLEVEIPKTAVSLSKEPDNEINAILITYLKKRGYSIEQIELDMLMRNGFSVLWPYFEYEELVYWQSRNIMNKVFEFPPTTIEKDGKVVGRLEHSKSDFLYGFDGVKYNQYVVIAEAIFCKMSLGDNAVATCGSDISDMQISKLALKKPKAVILAGDMDKTGIKTGIISNAKKIVSRLGCKVYYSLTGLELYTQSDVKDWNDLYTKHVMRISEIRDFMIKNMKPFNEKGLFDLHNLLTKL